MTIIDILTNPDLLKQAQAYFAEQTKTTKWQSLIPVDTKAPVDLNREKMERFRPELEKLKYDPSKYSTYMEQLGITYPHLKK